MIKKPETTQESEKNTHLFYIRKKTHHKELPNIKLNNAKYVI